MVWPSAWQAYCQFLREMGIIHIGATVQFLVCIISDLLRVTRLCRPQQHHSSAHAHTASQLQGGERWKPGVTPYFFSPLTEPTAQTCPFSKANWFSTRSTAAARRWGIQTPPCSATCFCVLPTHGPTRHLAPHACQCWHTAHRLQRALLKTG